MSSIVEINESKTEVRITINASLAEVEGAIDDLAKELNVYTDDPSATLEAVAQATKNWWFSQVVSQKAKQIEEYAKSQAEAIKTQALEQLNNSPLRGA